MRIANKFQIRRKIGSGSFGDIYLGVNIISGEEVAIKLENIFSKHPQLEYEARVYKTLAGGTGIPFIRWFGSQNEYNALVMDRSSQQWSQKGQAVFCRLHEAKEEGSVKSHIVYFYCI